jgi:hypothetical protein
MVIVTPDSEPEMQGDTSRPAGSAADQSASEEMKFIQSVLDSMVDENLDVMSKEELEEIIWNSPDGA